MSVVQARPKFGGKLNVPLYYEKVNEIITEQRPLATLREIAEKLNVSNLTTPRGLMWTRLRVAQYLKHNNKE